MTLKNIICSEIVRNGPMNVSKFMEHCLYDKKFGYYTSKAHTVGAEGDFITSPEISQVFGELIGIWLGQTWIDRGKPKPFSLVELGPGNGTMMHDILNATQTIPGFTESLSVVLVETSDALRIRQENILNSFCPLWVKSITEIPEQPFFSVANEFLDALPIRQFKKYNNLWHERSIALNDKDELQFIYIPSEFNKELRILYRDVPDNVIIEISDTAKDILSSLSKKLQKNGGVSLFIDYGYFEGVGETLQAVFKHAHANPLANLGKTDLSAQVNFKNIYNLVQKYELRASDLHTQGNFLKGLGIKDRCELLAKRMAEPQKRAHFQAIDRLVKKNQMGDLFKVMGVTNKGSPQLPLLEQP